MIFRPEMEKKNSYLSEDMQGEVISSTYKLYKQMRKGQMNFFSLRLQWHFLETCPERKKKEFNKYLFHCYDFELLTSLHKGVIAYTKF